jgi:NADPH-dependent curcumin reductase CurA
MSHNTQIVYATPPADGALPDPAATFTVVHSPLDPEGVDLKAGEVLVENQYLSIDPYHRFGLYDPAVTRSQFPVTEPGTIISTYGISRVVRSANPEYAVVTCSTRGFGGKGSRSSTSRTSSTCRR